MNSKLVTTAIKNQIRPILKEIGFTTYTTRKFWRHKTDRIEVIDFKSTGNILFNLPKASFSVKIGIYFLKYPLKWEVKTKNNILLPEESECPFRMSLKKNLNQKFHDTSRSDTWFVTDNDSLTKCLEDVINSLKKYAIPFFKKFECKEEVLRFLLEEEVKYFGNYVGIHGMGPIKSPMRKRQIAYFALLYDRKDIAITFLKKVIEEDGEIWLDELDDYKKDYQELLNIHTKNNKP